MKFYFTSKITRQGSAVKSSAEAKKLVAKRKGSSLARFEALERNEQIDLFGVFDGIPDKEKRRSRAKKLLLHFKRLLSSASDALKLLPRRFMLKRRKPPLKTSRLLATVAVVLAICAASGYLTLFLLFGAYFGRYETLSVPNLVSLSLEEALQTQSDVFEYTVVYRSTPEREIGEVISQAPAPNMSRKLYSNGEKIRISLVVNQKDDAFVMPSTIVLSAREVLLTLKNAGLNVCVLKEYSDDVPSGKVSFCSHKAGSSVDATDKISIYVSRGKAPRYATLPSLYGLSENEAIAKLEGMGLRIGKITYSASSRPVGTVIAQEYAAGLSLLEGRSVSLTVSGGIYFKHS